jgi:hypothetical protein
MKWCWMGYSSLMRVRSMPLVILAATAAATAGGCSSSSPDDDASGGKGGSSTGATGAGASVGVGGTGVGGTGVGGTGTGGAGGLGGGISVTGGASGSGGSAGDIAECAGDISKAELLPLDIYVMLDSSGSMLDLAAGATKWSAVSRALTTFLTDAGSAGIGVGLQFFPRQDPSVPPECTSDAECGTHGPCFLRFCQSAGPDIFPCGGAADCIGEDDTDFGPCTPLTYCWSEVDLVLCHSDADCPVAGDCVPFNQCSDNPDYACKVAGVRCGTPAEGLGTCEAFNPPSFCVHSTDCSNAAYAAPAAEIDVLPAAADNLRATIEGHAPAGDTPTAPALAGAIDHAKEWATAHPDHKVVVLLATDGLPTECIADPVNDPSGITGVVEAATAGVDGSPSVPTFVIGVFASTDVDARPNLDAIASAGGTEAAFLVDTDQNVEAGFLAALDAVRGTRLACEFAIPAPAAGKTLDYQQVNVRFTDAANQATLFYWSSVDDCDPATGGWYYDVDPAEGTPTSIIACPASCHTFQAATNGSVEIQLGCTTVTVVK